LWARFPAMPAIFHPRLQKKGAKCPQSGQYWSAMWTIHRLSLNCSRLFQLRWCSLTLAMRGKPWLIPYIQHSFLFKLKCVFVILLIKCSRAMKLRDLNKLWIQRLKLSDLVVKSKDLDKLWIQRLKLSDLVVKSNPVHSC